MQHMHDYTQYTVQYMR